MTYRFTFGRDARVNALLGAGHFLSHFYQLCLPPLFIAWQQAFDVSFAELGLAMAVMAGAAAVMQTPMGFLVDRYGARPFPGRRDPVDDPVDRRDGARHRLLAGRRAGVAVGGRQFGHSTRRITRSSAGRSIGRNWAGPSPFTPLSAMSGLPPPRRRRPR